MINVISSQVLTSLPQSKLSLTIDRNLNFNEPVSNLCKIACLKITALTRVFPYITQNQRRTLMKAYFMSQFGYCLLVGMNHSRSLNNRINTLHERTLHPVYNGFTSSFSKILKKDNSVTKHPKTLPNFAIEMFKVKHSLAPEIITEVFRLKTTPFNTRNKFEF